MSIETRLPIAATIGLLISLFSQQAIWASEKGSKSVFIPAGEYVLRSKTGNAGYDAYVTDDGRIVGLRLRKDKDLSGMAGNGAASVVDAALPSSPTLKQVNHANVSGAAANSVPDTEEGVQAGAQGGFNPFSSKPREERSDIEQKLRNEAGRLWRNKVAPKVKKIQ